MAWLAAYRDSWKLAFEFNRPQSDYYNLLVRGFLDGHLYLKAQVHPDLLSKDPVVRSHAPYLLDANLYHGRYYLYYGVVPAVLVMLPYTWLTGLDLPLNAVTLWFVALGFLVAVRLYFTARKHYFPDSSTWTDVLCLLLLAFGPMTPSLIRRSAHYELPIAAGYALIMGTLYCLFRLQHDAVRRLRWLAGASALLGLCVGCRPNYLLSLPFLIGLSWWCRRGDSTQSNTRWQWYTAALLPAGLIGLLLAAYNYGRFGDPFEFGFKYGLNEFFATGKSLISAAFIWPNLAWYYFTPPVLATYFPYCFPINANQLPLGYYSSEAVHGQWIVILLAVVALLTVIHLRRRSRLSSRAPVGLWAACAWIGLSNLLFMSLLSVRANRYMVDFQAPFILLLAVLVGGRMVELKDSGWASRTLRFALAGTTLLVAIFNLMSGIQLFDLFKNSRPTAFKLLSSYGNRPDAWLARFGFARYGPLRFKVSFPPAPAAMISQSLVATGLPNQTDVLFLRRSPDGMVQSSLFHEGFGSLEGTAFPVESGKEYLFEVDMGSLYPPRQHPFFDGWSDRDFERLKTTARVLVDGREVLSGRQQFHDSPPFWIHLGRNPAGVDSPFTGKISAVERLSPRSLHDLSHFTETGVWRLQVSFPLKARLVGQPIIGSGVSGAGNLLSVTILDEQTIRFGFDQWGAGLVESPPVKISSAGPHTLEVYAGGQVAKQELPPDWQVDPGILAAHAKELRLWLDGQLVWITPILANQDSYDYVALGHNRQGFSSATTYFTGNFQKAPLSAAEQREFILRNLRPPSP